MGRQSRSGTHEAEAELDGPSMRSVAELQAQIDGLRAQVAQLTRSGHDLIATQTRMQSLLHRATDAMRKAIDGEPRCHRAELEAHRGTVSAAKDVGPWACFCLSLARSSD